MMKKIASLLSATAFLVILCGGSALFAQDSKNVTFQVTLSAYYNLSIGQTTITFSDEKPASVENPTGVSIGANENPVIVTTSAIINKSKKLKLTVTANGNLIDGDKTIDIGAISWTVTGDSGYQLGTLQLGTDVTAGSWEKGSIHHNHVGNFKYFFARDYKTQEPGIYTATATYTLSAV